MSAERIEIIGENYEWRESSAEIVHKTTRTARLETDYEAKVDVYEDRVNGWFFNVAGLHVNGGSSPGDYLAVMVVAAYIEGVEQYRNGTDTPRLKSREWFIKGAHRIFESATDEAINRFWIDVRNGMFHDGFTKGPSLLSHDFNSPIAISGKYLQINPKLLLSKAVTDFEKYLDELRKCPRGFLGANFSKLWSERWNLT